MRHFINKNEIIEDIIPGDLLGDHVNLGFELNSNEDDLEDLKSFLESDEMDEDGEEEDPNYRI